MSLFKKLTDDRISFVKTQMKGDSLELKLIAKQKASVLVMVIAKAKDIAKSKKVEEPTDEMITEAIKKELKQLQQTKDSCISDASKDLLAETLMKEELLLEYLPKQLSEGDLTIKITNILESIEDKTNRGLVMKTVMSECKNLADGKLVNTVVNELLSTK